MNDLLNMCGIGRVSSTQSWDPESQKRWAYNQMAQMRQYGRLQTAETNLEACLRYFRNEGLTNEQIRKAITPALFAALKGKSTP